MALRYRAAADWVSRHLVPLRFIPFPRSQALPGNEWGAMNEEAQKTKDKVCQPPV